jgi:hypothetical protein
MNETTVTTPHELEIQVERVFDPPRSWQRDDSSRARARTRGNRGAGTPPP